MRASAARPPLACPQETDLTTEFDDSLLQLPDMQRMQLETRQMVILAHGLHMLARSAAARGSLGELSLQVLRITGIPAAARYRVGDFERLSQDALPDPLARQKLDSLSDLVRRSIDLQSEPEVKLALSGLMKRFPLLH